ncbi:hypothetical protein EV182_004808 [Spiromyces aspiralis]|uniref:Uncharacterized protein n=1 Tax=Spiromyces aspiralis TaxID=68401 RepID=A0ACC1HS75_9FUNG|nr:hypothetical protein EV182_004808 [Spiromyces aspiralis]
MSNENIAFTETWKVATPTFTSSDVSPSSGSCLLSSIIASLTKQYSYEDVFDERGIIKQDVDMGDNIIKPIDFILVVTVILGLLFSGVVLGVYKKFARPATPKIKTQ